MASIFMALLPIMVPCRSSPHLGHCRNDPRDILRARQAVIAVLDHGQHHIVARQPLRQREGVLPRHVRIPRALQNADWTPDLDGAAEYEMATAILDQGARDRVGLAILRRPQPDAAGFDLLPGFR